MGEDAGAENGGAVSLPCPHDTATEQGSGDTFNPVVERFFCRSNASFGIQTQDPGPPRCSTRRRAPVRPPRRERRSRKIKTRHRPSRAAIARLEAEAGTANGREGRKQPLTKNGGLPTGGAAASGLPSRKELRLWAMFTPWSQSSDETRSSGSM
ncbi:hypothetical protein EYF80_050696 [Liparis tanakae]|uniref:Uncharacterized protein n=1 Tax=Liparis tanakae TaxID=230148 RepID=A0A4Z2FFE3_9TELE|nr:hypothetical protein EYF80_050696 [Liparis tanakae]